MEMSASAPCLGTEAFDYQLPANGIGNTGHARKIQLGHSSRDDGKHTSRINVIVKQAGKVPGPGMYIKHKEWTTTNANKFCNEARGWKPMHKNPDPSKYEAKDFAETKGIGARSITSNHPKIQFGKIQPGKRRGFLDGPMKLGGKTPGPGAHNPPAGCNNGLGTGFGQGARKMCSWDKEKHQTVSGKIKVPDVAPNHYKITYGSELRQPDYTVQKGKGNNFIDKMVKEKMMGGKELPGPGTYDLQNFSGEKISRGTYHMQLRGLSRGPASGYM